MFIKEHFYINKDLQALLAREGLRELNDFLAYSEGKCVSRTSKRKVWELTLSMKGQVKKYFLKQVVFKWGFFLRELFFNKWCLDPSTTRERQIIELYQAQGLPVMKPVAWGERKVLGLPISGFLLLEGVVGREFLDVYKESSLKRRRRLRYLYGKLVGCIHNNRINTKVRPRDLIVVSPIYTDFRKCFVVIDRENGSNKLQDLSMKKRATKLAEMWLKGGFTIGLGRHSELLAFLAGYISESDSSPTVKLDKKEYGTFLIINIFDRAEEIFNSQIRFARLRPEFERVCDRFRRGAFSAEAK